MKLRSKLILPEDHPLKQRKKLGLSVNYSKKLRCENCGQKISYNDKFCFGCGLALNSSEI